MKRLIVIAGLVLALCARSWAASSVIQTKTAAVSATTVAATFDSPVAAGSSIVVICEGDAFDLPTGITDNRSNSYSLNVDSNSVPAAGKKGGISWAVNTASGSTTVTATYSASAQHTIIIAEIGNVSTSPADVHIATTGTAATASSGASTPTAQATEIVIGWAVTQNAGAGGITAAGSGYSNLITLSSAGFESKNVATTGAQTATFGLNTPQGYVCGVVTFKDAATGLGAHLLPLLGAGT